MYKPRTVKDSSQTRNSHIGDGNSAQASYTNAPPAYGSYQPGAYASYGQPNYDGIESMNGYSQYGRHQIHNPYPDPAAQSFGTIDQGRNDGNYDPETEAQIAQWQSFYASKDDQAGAGTSSGVGQPSSNQKTAQDAAPTHNANVKSSNTINGADGKPKTVMRAGGGKEWHDTSLLEWDPSHFRLFVGNLAGEVTDDSLRKGFAAYPSLVKTRVVRDKQTSKSKGYGFVSFSDADEYFRAAKEMQSKYIGSHPIIIKKAKTDIKAVNVPDKKRGKGHGSGGVGAGGGADTGAGVKKKQPAKTKGGLKILG